MIVGSSWNMAIEKAMRIKAFKTPAIIMAHVLTIHQLKIKIAIVFKFDRSRWERGELLNYEFVNMIFKEDVKIYSFCSLITDFLEIFFLQINSFLTNQCID